MSDKNLDKPEKNAAAKQPKQKQGFFENPKVPPIMSVVAGVLSLLLSFFVSSMLGLLISVCGLILGIGCIRRGYEMRGVAMAGTVLSALNVVIFAGFMIYIAIAQPQLFSAA